MITRLAAYAKAISAFHNPLALLLLPAEKRVIIATGKHRTSTPHQRIKMALLTPPKVEMNERFDDTIETLIYHAKNLALQGDAKQASIRIKEAYYLLDRNPKNINIIPRTLMCADALVADAFMLQADEQPAESMLAIRKAVFLKKNLLGTQLSVPEINDIMQEMALLYLYQGKFTEAKQIFSEIFDAYSDTVNPSMPHRVTAGLNLAASHMLLGNQEKSLALLTECLRICYPHSQLTRDIIGFNLGLTHLNLSKKAEAHIPPAPQKNNHLSFFAS